MGTSNDNSKLKLIFSPHNFVQEPFQDDVWKILVCCILLNQTTHVQVRKVLPELFKRYPNHVKMARANRKKLVEIVRLCGFYNVRCRNLINMSKAFGTVDVQDLPGVGKYAHDAYLLFHLKDLTTQPLDKELIRYKAWLQTL